MSGRLLCAACRYPVDWADPGGVIGLSWRRPRGHKARVLCSVECLAQYAELLRLEADRAAAVAADKAASRAAGRHMTP